MEVTPENLNALFASEDGIDRAHFELDEDSGRFFGSVVSRTFSGKNEAARQKEVWDRLQSRLGENVVLVGEVCTYTPFEWLQREIGDE